MVLVALAALSLGGGLVATSASAATCTTSSVNVMAHPDDDLYFVNPATLQDIRSGGCITTVYVTSGDAGRADSYYLEREVGVRAAYAQMAGVPSTWNTTSVTVANKRMTVSLLPARPGVELVFLRLPDGFGDGSGSARSGGTSLQKLYQGTISTLRTLDAPQQSYTKAQLTQVLGALITGAGATTVRGMDNVGTFGGGDHSDHYAAGKFAADARAGYAPSATFRGYLGYTTTRLPENVFGADRAAKADALFAYAPHDPGTCINLGQCSISDAAKWLARQHPNTDTT